MRTNACVFQGKLNGLAVRVPLTNSSITDCVFEVKKDTTVEEVNKLLKVCMCVCVLLCLFLMSRTTLQCFKSSSCQKSLVT